MQEKIKRRHDTLVKVRSELGTFPETILDLDRKFFRMQLGRNAVIGGHDYAGCTDISLSPADAADVRSDIGAFVLGEEDAPTSALVVEILKLKIPGFKRLGLAGVSDLDGRALSALLKAREKDPGFGVYTTANGGSKKEEEEGGMT